MLFIGCLLNYKGSGEDAVSFLHVIIQNNKQTNKHKEIEANP